MTKVEAKDLLDLRGDLPNPRRIDTSELNKLPRVQTRTTDRRDPSREISPTKAISAFTSSGSPASRRDSFAFLQESPKKPSFGKNADGESC